MKHLEEKLALYQMLNPQVKRLRREIFIGKIQHAYQHQKIFYLKRILITICIIGGFYCVYRLSIYNSALRELVGIYAKRPNSPLIDTVYLHDSTKTQEAFLNKIGHFESRGNYKVVNQYGYLGKYQFSSSTLKGLGLDISQENFLHYPQLQEVAMHVYMKRNKIFLAKYIGTYQGRIIKNILITESGILASAHLGGPGAVQNFLDSNGSNDFQDANGTPISRYLKEMGGYRINFN